MGSTKEELRGLVVTWRYEQTYAERLWAEGIHNISQIANAEKDDLAAILAGGEPVTHGLKVHASDMIKKAKEAGQASTSSQAGASAGAGAAAAAESPVDRFLRLLGLSEPLSQDNDDILRRVIIHFPSSLLHIRNKQDATTVFNRAARLPGTSTKACAKFNKELFINGDFLPSAVTKSTLLYAFQRCVPMLLKIPVSNAAAQHESRVWAKISAAGAPPYLAGPISLEELHGTSGVRYGLLMPLYPATLQHMPSMLEADALRLGRQVQQALAHLHQHGLAHCDVKAPNVFISSAGDAYLADFGSTRDLGKDADEKTGTHVPEDAAVNVDLASAALDHLLLAVTLAERLGLLEVRHGLKMEAVRNAVAGVQMPELREFLDNLLP